MFKFKKIALMASIFTATALSLAAFAACGEPTVGPAGPKGDKGDPGATGATGDKGDKGDAGVGINEITYDDDGNMVITMTDGTTKTVKNAVPTEEHKFGKDAIALVKDGTIGEVTPGQKATGLFVCLDCGDVYAQDYHAHNLDEWKRTDEKSILNFGRDCLVFKNGTNGDLEKVADEHQSLKLVTYSEVVNGEGWKKGEDSNKKTIYSKEDKVHNGMWVVTVEVEPSCNKTGSVRIQYFTKDGAETKDEDNKVTEGVAKDLYKTNINYNIDNAETDAEKEAFTIPVTQHYFDVIDTTEAGNVSNKIYYIGQFTTEGDKALEAGQLASVSKITYKNLQNAKEADAHGAKAYEVAAGYDKAYYFVACTNCDPTSDVAIKYYEANVVRAVKNEANCAEEKIETIDASVSIVAGEKTFKKNATTLEVATAAMTAESKKHVYNVYDKNGDVRAYYQDGKFYKAKDLKEETTKPEGATLVRKENDVVAVTCANCSGGKIAYNIPKARLGDDEKVWKIVTNTDPTETEKGKLVYSVDFNKFNNVTTDADGAMAEYTTDIEYASIGHTAKLGDLTLKQVKALKVGNAVATVGCGNAGSIDGCRGGYGTTNQTIKNGLGIDENGRKPDTPDYNDKKIKTYDTLVVTDSKTSVAVPATCKTAGKNLITITVSKYTQAIKDGVAQYDASGAPVWDETKTVTYNAVYEEKVVAAEHLNEDKTTYKETVVAFPSEDQLGLVEYKCSLCGHVYYKILPTINTKESLANTTDVKVNDPTCVADGYTMFKSTYVLANNTVDVYDITTSDYDGDDTDPNKYEDIGTRSKEPFKQNGEAKLGHQMGEWKPATGAHSDYKWIQYCERVHTDVHGNKYLDGYYIPSDAETNPGEAAE